MSRRDAGFTLVEVLVALALTALVSLLLLHGVRLAAAGLDRHARRAERLDDRRSLDELLRRVLSSAASGSFVGRPTTARFLSLAEDSGPGLYRIEIAREGSRLILRRRLAGPSADPQIAEAVLAGDVVAFGFAYFGAPSAAEAPGWHQDWEGLTRLPLLVRVSLDTAAAPPRPPLVVPLWSAGP
jgi:general secretion pathway protein J